MIRPRRLLLRFFVPAYILLLVAGCAGRERLFKSVSDFDRHPILSEALVGVSIYDPQLDAYVFEHQANKRFIPASNTKLLTAYAAMKHLPERLPGWFYREDRDTLFLWPNGDPTLFHADFKQDALLAYLGAVEKPVVVQIERQPAFGRLGTGWPWTSFRSNSYPDRSQLPIYANRAYTRTLSVGGESEVNYALLADTLGNLLPGLRLSLQWVDKSADLSTYEPLYTQDTDEVVGVMMKRSDNFIAEQLLMMVGSSVTGRLSDREAIKYLLANDFAVFGQHINWADGSGLSRSNLMSPRFFVELLKNIQSDLGWERVSAILPGGDEGTLKGLYKGHENAIKAKTGTLNATIALSGYLRTKNDKQLIFSFLVNNQPSAAADVRAAIEDYLTELIQRYR